MLAIGPALESDWSDTPVLGELPRLVHVAQSGFRKRLLREVGLPHVIDSCSLRTKLPVEMLPELEARSQGVGAWAVAVDHQRVDVLHRASL